MRNAIGTARVFQFVIIFILIFAAYLALSIKYSKTFKMKNEVINILERDQGITNKAKEVIANYLDASGYNATGKCETGTIGVNGTTTELANGSKKYDYCITRTSGYNERFPQMSYYRVTLFYKFGLPYIDNIFTFEVSGETVDVRVPRDNI